MKKALAILLVIAMLLVMLPTMALAASTIEVRNSAEFATALTTAADGDTIFLYNGEYLFDQTTLNMNLTITGESEAGVVLKPTGDTGPYSTSGGDTSGWLFLQTGSLNISNLTMDGTGFIIAQALRTKGALTVENVTIKNIEERQYFGFGIGVYQPGSLVATNVTMSNIARVGIHAKGDTDIDGFSYTGKGAITCLDYAMEIGTFDGSMTPFTVDVNNASITDCLGIADDSAGSGSAALYINTYFYQAGGGTTSLITVNISYSTVSNSSVGAYVGYYEKGEYSDTVISDTNFINCDTDLHYEGLAGTSSFTTNGNYYGGGAPTVTEKYGNVITNINSYKYMVTFDSQGGSSVDDVLVVNNETMAEPAEPTKTENVFDGWYTEAAFTNEWNFAADTVTADTTLYAKWTTNEYTVTFDSQGGSAVASVTADYGTKITEPTAPTKQNYAFDGWYKENTYSNEWAFATDTVAADATLYAQWTATSPDIATGAITGTLLDSDDNPLVGYPVTLHSTPITVITDATGEFVFNNVPLTDHTLIVKKVDGTEIGRFDLNLCEGETSNANVSGASVDITFTEQTATIDLLLMIDPISNDVTVEDVVFTENPKTGETVTETLYYLILPLAFLALIAGIVVYRKRSNAK